MKIETIYEVHYFFPIEKQCRSCFLPSSKTPYVKRVQEFKNEDDACEFLSVVEQHFQKSLPECKSVMNKKYFVVKKKHKLVKGSKCRKQKKTG